MEHEAIIRLSIFLGIFGTLSLVEVLNPRRARVISRKKRWFTNWGIILVDTLALRLLALALPLLAVGAAADAHVKLGMGHWSLCFSSVWARAPRRASECFATFDGVHQI